MKLEVKIWLQDIVRSIDEINDFLPEKRDFYQFQKDLKTKKTIERNIEIIGEALSRVLKQEANLKITDSRKIVDTRNRIIHGYDTVTEDIIWLIVVKYLPILKKEVEELLK